MTKDVIVLCGSGAIGIAIVRRIAIGKQLLLADKNPEHAEHQAQQLRNAGFNVHTAACDVSNPQSVNKLVETATKLGKIMGLVNTAGVSPSQASVAQIFNVDLYGNALLLDAFSPVMAKGSSALVIGSQSSHRLAPLTQEQTQALALTPTEALLDLPFIKNVNDTLKAYQLAKRGNAIKVQAEAVKWGHRGARINCISAGIIHTPLANDELNGECKDFYRNMLKQLPAGRGGTPDEIANLAEFIMSDKGAYITGSDILIDGGATAKYWWDNNN